MNNDIAIIGISLRLPLINTLDEYWQALLNGKDCIRPLPETRKKEVLEYRQAKNYPECHFPDKGYLEDIHFFDSEFFNMSRKEARLMSPYQRLFLEVIWNAFEDAGLTRASLDGSNTGVFLGAWERNDYLNLIDHIEPQFFNLAIPWNTPSITGSRASYQFNLKGPSLLLDTTCSSSLFAVHYACQSLLSEECDMAVAGGISVGFFNTRTEWQLGIEAPDGRSKAFDDRADGTGEGEGVCAIVLKKMDCALHDGHNIHAVIKGTAINNDGFTQALTVPNPDAQAAVIERAWKKSNISLDKAAYIEAHGTGTKLGDPIEIRGLRKAFAQFTDRKNFCGLGSVKANLGHLNHASGITGLIKTVLVLKNKAIPPQIHFQQLNREINLTDSPFYISTSGKNLSKMQEPLLGGVSSFGMDGSNSHVVLCEAPAIQINYKNTSIKYEILVLSALENETLKQRIKDIIFHLSTKPDLDYSHICYTASCARDHYHVRLALLTENKEDAVAKLSYIINLSEIKNKPEQGIFYSNGDSSDPEHQCQTQSDFQDARRNSDTKVALALCEEYVNQQPIDWTLIYQPEESIRVHLPGYPYKRERCWINVPHQEKKLTATIRTQEPIEKEQPVEGTAENILSIIRTMLEAPEIKLDDNYHDFGMDSIGGLNVILKLKKVLQTEISLSDLYLFQTVAELAGYIAKNKKSSFSSIIPAAPAEYYQTSSAQKRLYILDKFQNIGIAYNLPFATLIEGPIDINRLKNALNALIDRHEALRTSFAFLEDKSIVQKIHRPGILILEVEEKDASNMAYSMEVFQKEIDSFIRPFDLTKAPLFRVKLIRFKDQMIGMVTDSHHIIMDGASTTLFRNDLFDLYDGKEISPQKIHYKDFALWQNESFKDAAIEKQRDYWLSRFSNENEIPVLNMATDFVRPNLQKFEGSEVHFELDEKSTELIKKQIKQSGVTLFQYFLCIYFILLHKYSNQTDIIIGIPISNRRHQVVQNTIGMFLNTLPIRTHITPEDTFETYLQLVKNASLQALDNQDFPLEQLIDNLDLRRDASRNPLFDVCFTLWNFNRTMAERKNYKVKVPIFKNNFAKFDLSLNAYENDAQIKFTLEYCSRLFHKSTVERIASHYIKLTTDITARPSARIDQLDILLDDERQKILENFNPPLNTPLPAATVVDLFFKQVKLNPKAIAVCFGDACITYSELNERSNQVAHYLKSNGIGFQEAVGLMVPRSDYLIIAILGILKAGAYYLPIDSAFPNDRIQYMLDDSACKFLLTHKSIMDKANELSVTFRIDIADPLILQADKTNPKLHNCADDLIYNIYTSGSTAKPKGVMLMHRNIVNFVHAMSKEIEFGIAFRFLALTTVSFDIFVLETFLPLSLGKTIVMAAESEQKNPELLENLILKNQIDVLQMTPSRLKLLFTYRNNFNVLKYTKLLILGGEALQDKLLTELKQEYTGRIFNVYGPTETAVWSTLQELTNETRITIGHPIQNTQVLILDKNKKLLGIGIPGDLTISGQGVAKGYRDKPELTAQRFITNPYGPEEFPLYETGDLARWLNDGRIEFLGRSDNQVKIRGYRIELGEIENILNLHPNVDRSVVNVRKDKQDNLNLIAYIIPKADQESAAEGRENKVDQWNTVWDLYYHTINTKDYTTFNTTGWNDSYSGSPIPEPEMREWLDGILDRIVSFQPRNVLEIGCGTGMILFNTAKHCETYTGIDIAQAAIDFIGQVIQDHPGMYEHVKLYHAKPEDFLNNHDTQYDMVVINSVMQYFPDSTYAFQLIKRLVKVIHNDGILFLGDIRNNDLNYAFKTSIVLEQSSSAEYSTEIEQKINTLYTSEEELLFSPLFFYAIQKSIPEISHVEIRYKNGRYLNELNRFRYDAILHIKKIKKNDTSMQQLKWTRELQISELKSNLLKNSPSAFLLRRVPNIRTQSLLKILENIQKGVDSRNIEEYKEQYKENKDYCFQPDMYLNLDDRYKSDIIWSGIDEDQYFDILYVKKDLFENDPRFVSSVEYSELKQVSQWDLYVNQPIRFKLNTHQLDSLRFFIRQKLPNYMEPAYIIQLDYFPMTANNKIDLKRLPTPFVLEPSGDIVVQEPANEIEAVISSICKAELELTHINPEEVLYLLGANSINIVKIQIDIEKHFGVPLPFEQIYMDPTVRSLSIIINNQKGGLEK